MLGNAYSEEAFCGPDVSYEVPLADLQTKQVNSGPFFIYTRTEVQKELECNI